MNRNFNEVFFTDVRVPKHQIVGQRGEGWMVANVILKHERDSLADPKSIVGALEHADQYHENRDARRPAA